MKTVKIVAGLLLVFAMVLSAASMSGCGGSDNGEDKYRQVRQVARIELWKEINSEKASCASVADREKNLPVTASTIFNMGSISKTFVSTAVMLLVDEGKVELDAPVVRYLPEFRMEDPRYKDITVRMLLNHTSGMPGTAYSNKRGIRCRSFDLRLAPKIE